MKRRLPDRHAYRLAKAGILGGFFAAGVILAPGSFVGNVPVIPAVTTAVAATTVKSTDVPPPMYTPAVPGESAVADLVSEERMLADVRALVAVGNRFGGSRSNQAAARYAAEQLRNLGLEVEVVNDPPAVWTFDQGPYSLTLVSPADTGIRFDASHPYNFSAKVDQPDVDVTAEVVYVGTGDKAEQYQQAAGKIVLMDGSPRRYGKLAADAGAVAILTDYPNNPEIYRDAAMLASLSPTDEKRLPVMALSYTEGQALKELLSTSTQPVVVNFKINQHIYQAEPVTLIARLTPADASSRGKAGSQKFFVVLAHGDGDSGGPSADDNASGVAAVLEIARVLKTAMDKGIWKPAFGLEFLVLGKEYHSSAAWIKANANRLDDLLGVINFDEVGTGASRDAIFFESPDVPYNELLLRTFDSVGRDYAGLPGYWKEYATDDSLGGTDSYAFLARWTARGNGRFDGSQLIPATTVFTAAWYTPDVIDQVPYWPNKGLAPGDPVVVDFSSYYHSSRDLPETTTEREPFNLVNAARAGVLVLIRLQALFSRATPFADDATARFDPNRLYAEALYAAGVWQPPLADKEDPLSRPVADLAGHPTVGEVAQLAYALSGEEGTGWSGNTRSCTVAVGFRQHPGRSYRRGST